MAAVSKFVGSIIQTVVGVGLTLTGNPAGLALIASGVSSLAGAILAPSASRSETTETSRKSPIPPRTRAYGPLRLYGDWIFFGTKPDGTPVDVWAFHDGQANAITQVYLNDDKVTIVGGIVQQLPDKRYRDNRVAAGYSMGLPTETAFATVMAEIPGIWTADHRGDGVVTGYLIKYLTKADKFLETYPNGDDIQMSLAGEWSLVFDPRDPGQDAYDPSTWEYRDNSALALLHSQLVNRGRDYDTAILPQIDSWIAAANDCDVAMPLAAGGTEKRYRLALAHRLTETPAAIDAAILNTFDGWYCENERGEVRVYSGRYSAPTVSIGRDKIVSYSLQRHVAAEDAINEVLVTYVSAAHEYATVDAQSWRDEGAISASGRPPVSAPLDAQMPSPTQGRRLAKRKMIRANAPFRGTVSTTYGGRDVLGERYIDLRIEEAGTVFYDGPAEIVGSPERDPRTGGVSFEWVAIGPEIDAWDAETEDGDANVPGDNPGVDPLPDPVIDDADVTLTDFGAQVSLDVTAPEGDDLTWSLRWRIEGDTTWTPTAVVDSDPGAPVVIVFGYLPLEADIEIEVMYGSGDGRTSDWSNTFEVSTAA